MTRSYIRENKINMYPERPNHPDEIGNLLSKCASLTASEAEAEIRRLARLGIVGQAYFQAVEAIRAQRESEDISDPNA
jgi:hypothetical protein